jgi:hypothetical protein
MTLGEALNNPGNIEANGTPWHGEADVQPNSKYVAFSDPVYGIRALAKTLLT